ncbi:acetate/propionate family kinase [Flaviflexus massiliensis]|uniref:acetate/propionate family kinase n=1 Tax=Flaviflexus massiliensis TaxID=1522309 RepID=UPI0006D55C2B|nr:acetate kinase [Flaviflexus massiliensis]
MTVLVINSGSSSIKYQLVDPESGEALAVGLVEQIGEGSSHIKHTYRGEKHEFDEPLADHGEGLRYVLNLFDTIGPKLSEAGIKAVGHRVVQGGNHFDSPVLITPEVRDLVEELSPLAPLHNPANLRGIDVARDLLDVPHVAVFDTAFFQTLPEEAARYALNREVADKYGIRRYGAHGTSHQFVSESVTEYVGRTDLKQIVLHLGNGASVSAVVNGKAVDTSMGLTPLEGLVMGTRTGDIDPAAIFHLRRVGGMNVDEIDNLFNKQSGLKGLAGENDMRAVWALAEGGDAHAREGLDIYVHRIVKYIGSYAAVMGGLDVIAFTAGIGENDDLLRTEVVERLKGFGLTLDESQNAIRGDEIRQISTDESSVQVLVVPTNEELAIARAAMEIINK